MQKEPRPHMVVATTNKRIKVSTNSHTIPVYQKIPSSQHVTECQHCFYVAWAFSFTIILYWNNSSYMKEDVCLTSLNRWLLILPNKSWWVPEGPTTLEKLVGVWYPYLTWEYWVSNSWILQFFQFRMFRNPSNDNQKFIFFIRLSNLCSNATSSRDIDHLHI